MHHPRLSFVVLHFGSPTLTLECLESIEYAGQRVNSEIILVDNGSQLDDWVRLKQGLIKRGITVDHFIRLAENVGFARGMNAGIDRADGELVVALNSDTLIGAGVPSLILQQEIEDRLGFYALPVYDAELKNEGMRPTLRPQAEVTALTWYISCLPVGSDQIAERYVLGPPGPAVIMTRALVRWMKEMDGFVYDPRFFMYGEDVDLFIRARQHGFRTKPLHADIRRNEVIWHLGSGSTDPKVVRSVDKSPDMAGHVLSGCVRNLWLHAGTFEFIPLLLLHIWFRIAFCALYWRTHSWREVRFLALAGLPPGVRRSSRKRTAAFFLSGLVALMYRRPVVWARRWRTGSQSAIKKLEQNRAKRATTVID